jgi:hypothetical protein
MKSIIETAKECGSELFTGSETQGDIWTFTESTITAFADRIRQEERERCAVIAENTDEVPGGNSYYAQLGDARATAKAIAAAIRAAADTLGKA